MAQWVGDRREVEEGRLLKDVSDLAIPQSAGQRFADSGALSLYIWIALNAMDAFLTWHGLPRGAFEANPALAALAQVTSVPTMLLVKLLLAALLGLVLWQRHWLLPLVILDYFLLAIVAFNAYVLAFLL